MKHLVLDTETAGTLEAPLVYDIAWQVSDDDYSPIIAKRYLVREVFYGMAEKMQTAYYAEKLPQYHEEIAKGLEVRPFVEIMEEFANDCKQYKIKRAWAYNMAFDRKALNNTVRVLSNGFRKFFFPYGLKLSCIWAYACTTILNRPSYFKAAIAHNWFSESGNVKTNAEKAFAYLTKNPEFVEAHTALEDVRIENYILSRCAAVHTKGKKARKPSRNCWQGVTKAFKKWMDR